MTVRTYVGSESRSTKMEYVITDSIGELLVDFIYSNIKLILNTLSEKNKQAITIRMERTPIC